MGKRQLFFPFNGNKKLFSIKISTQRELFFHDSYSTGIFTNALIYLQDVQKHSHYPHKAAKTPKNGLYTEGSYLAHFFSHRAHGGHGGFVVIRKKIKPKPLCPLCALCEIFITIKQ
jgi:hypothetical protein